VALACCRAAQLTGMRTAPTPQSGGHGSSIESLHGTGRCTARADLGSSGIRISEDYDVLLPFPKGKRTYI